MTDKNAPRKPRSFAFDAEAKKPETPLKEAVASPRKPRALDVDSKVSKSREIILQPDEAVNDRDLKIDDLTPPVATLKKRRFGFGKLALSAFSALFALGAGLALDSFIRDLFSRNDWLGWLALVLTLLGTLGVFAVVVRELWGLSRLKTLHALRLKGAVAKAENDLEKARLVATEIGTLLANRPDTAHGRALLQEHGQDIMDGADLIALTERDLLAPLDRTARQMVMQSAKRVSIVTAVSPRALVDIGFVLFENMRLIRKIAEHYGGRPGTWSSLRLAREVITHLAATGAIAVGDGLIQQFIGHGLAARLSARLGEGVVNGLLTARIGIAAIDVCRPLDFAAEKRPGIGDFVSELVKTGKTADSPNNSAK